MSQGGIAFIAIKGILRIYFKQQQYLRQAQRKILDYDEPAPTPAAPAAPTEPASWTKCRLADTNQLQCARPNQLLFRVRTAGDVHLL